MKGIAIYHIRKTCTAGKQRLIVAHEAGENYYEIARILNIKRSTAWGIIRRHQITGVVELPREGARPAVQKLDEKLLRQTLVDVVERHPTFTSLQINTELRVRLPAKPEVSIAISSSLDGQLISMKKLEDAPEDRNRIDRILQIG